MNKDGIYQFGLSYDINFVCEDLYSKPDYNEKLLSYGKCFKKYYYSSYKLAPKEMLVWN